MAHVFKADVPGLKEEVKVEDDRVLQIRGEKSHEQEEKGTHGTAWSVAAGSSGCRRIRGWTWLRRRFCWCRII
ncbi:hypothetical protein RHGRI_034096 [Rhododendron griersonianum]|uniref:SHSP domain-containing protein n=1 Tax=Rhododendron griersonianum TaxID=479676 RepID=A0AAV6HZ76_9ERIC|nr:hypothetical protein RHGRI_034096 [Rhododendron griersonianum]